MPTRRDFLATSAAAMVAARFPRPTPELPMAGRTLLFQGDSITDAGRNRTRTGANDIAALGTGYPLLLSAELRDKYPATDLQLYNRGISGNVVLDLQARWPVDTIALNPAILSILIGVNDIWHGRGKENAGTAATYEAAYTALLAQTRAALPNTHLVVMEPFVTVTGAVDRSWFPEFDDYRAAAARVAKGAGARFVPLHAMLQKLSAGAGPAYWAADGVHPTLAGHQAIARQWMRVVGDGWFKER
ncbi:MAG: GDSL-type esterase/lipase family protein [Gemmatimonadota bacterium]